MTDGSYFPDAASVQMIQRTLTDLRDHLWLVALALGGAAALYYLVQRVRR